MTIPTENDQTNLLSRNRAVLDIQVIPEQKFYCQQFSLPDMNLPETVQGTPFSMMKFPGDHIMYGYLDFTFLVREDLANWIALHDWIRGLGFPAEFNEYVEKPNSFSDGSLVVFSNANNPIKTFKMIGMFPVRLGSLDFDQAIDQTTVVTSSATFAVQRYDIV